MPERLESTCCRIHFKASRLSPTGCQSVCPAIATSHQTRTAPSAYLGGVHSLAVIFACATILFSTIGCATIRGEKYTSKTLPPQLIAAERQNPQTIDFTRLAAATATSETVDAGDVLEMTIAVGLSDKDSVKMPLRVQEDGCADIPELGRMKLAGMEITAAEATIVSEAIHRGLYRNPNITLVMKTKRTNRIMVAGAVMKPKIYYLPRGQCDLLSALSAAEGLHPDAGTQVVIRNSGINPNPGPNRIASGLGNEVDRVGHTVGHGVGQSAEVTGSKPDTIRIDLISATKEGTGGYQLEDGAIVYVEKRDPEPLHVLGLVSKPGRFEFPVAAELRVMDAVAMAGGVNSIAADKIFVIRRKPVDPNAPPIDADSPDKLKTVVIQVSLANAKQSPIENIRLAPGDVVSVEQTPITFLVDRVQRTGFSFVSSIPLSLFGLP